RAAARRARRVRGDRHREAPRDRHGLARGARSLERAGRRAPPPHRPRSRARARRRHRPRRGRRAGRAGRELLPPARGRPGGPAMIALLALCLAADVRATLAADPARAEVGEPVVLSLVVERPSSVAVEAPKIEPGVLGSWMFVEALG